MDSSELYICGGVSAEFNLGNIVALIRKIMDDAKVIYQFAELGRVDLGGGGTIAYLMAKIGRVKP